MDVVAFSQRDIRWAGEMLGTGDLSIGQVGCLVSACASMLASWGVATDPHRLNEFIKRAYGYVDDNLFVFGSVDGLSCRFVELIDCERVPAPVARLQEAVAGGYGVLACVVAVPGGTLQRHWVWVWQIADGRWQIADPWMLPGQELRDLGAYLASGWDPARGIFAAAIYKRLEEREAFAWRAAGEAHQSAVCVRVADGSDASDISDGSAEGRNEATAEVL